MAKLFVGSLPDGISESDVAGAFQQFGPLQEVYIKPNCGPNQQCAFVTFTSADNARAAKEQTDRTLTFPESTKPCEVMIARNQGLAGRSGLDAQSAAPRPSFGSSPYMAVAAPVYAAAPQLDRPKKIHVGSLPDGIQEWQLAEEFSKYGGVTEIMVKDNCESGRQWAFVTFDRSEDAVLAKQSTDKVLVFPGAARPCEVVIAKNQGLYGQPVHGVDRGPVPQQQPMLGAPIVPVAMMSRPLPSSTTGSTDGRKLLVGSLPDGVEESEVVAAFESYGRIVDIYVKKGCAPEKQWAFVTFSTATEAATAKAATDKTLFMEGSVKACEVMFARASGGGGGMAPVMQMAAPIMPVAVAAPVNSCKIFVGSMPGDVTDDMLRDEFSRFGTIRDSFVKMGCEASRQWGFVVFSRPDEAMTAKESTDRCLVFPGGEKPCEVMIAKAKAGDASPAPAAAGGRAAPPAKHGGEIDVNSTSWRQYFTTTGVPYYHNGQTGMTQWERPPNLPSTGGPAAAYGAAAGGRVVPRARPY